MIAERRGGRGGLVWYEGSGGGSGGGVLAFDEAWQRKSQLAQDLWVDIANL